MAGKKPYQMTPAPPVKKPSFTNTLGDAFRDATDYAKRGMADAQDAYDSVKNKLTTGRYRQGVDSVTGKEWPYGRGYEAERADRQHQIHLDDRKDRDFPPPTLPPGPAPVKRPARTQVTVSRAAPAKPKSRTIDPYTADRDFEGDISPARKVDDNAIKARPHAGRPGSRKLAPAQAVRGGDIVTDRARVNDPGLNKKLPYMGAKTDTVNATVGGKKKAIRVPKAGKVSL